MDVGDDVVRNPARRRARQTVDVDALSVFRLRLDGPGLGEHVLAIREDDYGDRHARPLSLAGDLFDFLLEVLPFHGTSTLRALAAGQWSKGHKSIA